MKTTSHKHDGRVTVQFERQMKHPVERVWRAITERSQLNEWFPNDIGIDEIAADATLHYTFRGNEGPPGDGQVLEFDPPHHLVLNWYDAILRFDLTSTDDGGCVLVFSHDVEDDGERPARDSGGWQYSIDKLDALLGGPPMTEPTKDEWQQINAHYTELID